MMGEDEEWLLTQLDAIAQDIREERAGVAKSPPLQPLSQALPEPQQETLSLFSPPLAPEAAPVSKTKARKISSEMLPAIIERADSGDIVPVTHVPVTGPRRETPNTPPKPHYHGHRQRLREKFLSLARAEALATVADYELLELLLFLAIPQKDVKPLAKQLLAHFGSLGALFTAHPDDLIACPGIKENTAVALKVVQAAALHMMREEVINRPILSSWDRLLDYCHASMAFQDIEQFRILFLDRRNCLIADEVHQSGTVDHTPVYPREVVKRALELRACALILVHNHPSGDPQPSPADIEMTRKIGDALRHVDIALHDHLVMSRAGYTSFKADGLL